MDIIDQLKLMEAGKVTVFPCDQTIREARETIERLRDERSKENVALRAELSHDEIDAEIDRIVRGDLPSLEDFDEMKTDRDRLRAENAHYVQALAETIMLFDYAQSGFIPGCGEDLDWEKRKDEWLARVQAHEQRGS